jgi:hypothetical protein
MPAAPRQPRDATLRARGDLLPRLAAPALLAGALIPLLWWWLGSLGAGLGLLLLVVSPAVLACTPYYGGRCRAVSRDEGSCSAGGARFAELPRQRPHPLRGGHGVGEETGGNLGNPDDLFHHHGDDHYT